MHTNNPNYFAAEPVRILHIEVAITNTNNKSPEINNMTDTQPLPDSGASKSVGGAVADVLNNRSSDTNLLDSCVDDDDDDDDNASVEACGSNEEYAMYVDATGRQRQPQDVTLPNHTSVVTTTKVDTTFCTPVPPPLTAVTPDSMTYTPKMETSSPTCSRRNVCVSPPGMDGLEFDMNEPWERSLLRQLEQPKKPVASSPNRYECKHDDILPTNTRPMMLLGHTESRDYAMEYDVDDTISLETTSSCPLGKKMQFIHRSPYTIPQPRVVYHIPSSNDDDHNNYPADNYYYHQPTDASQHINNQLPIIVGRNKHHSTAASSLTNGTNMTEDGRDDEMIMMTIADAIVYKKIPAHLPINASKQQQQQHYLEMEASMGEGASYSEIDFNEQQQQQQQQQQHYMMNHPNTDQIQPDPGCFCLGYNMLDYIISSAPVTQQQRPVGLNGKKQRHNIGVLRPVRLPRVSETYLMSNESPPTNGHDSDNVILSDVIDASAAILSTRLPTEKTKSRSVVEPEGSYLPHTDQFHFSTPDGHNHSSNSKNDTRRQGVEL